MRYLELAILAVGTVSLASCSALAQAPSMEEMTDPEFEAWRAVIVDGVASIIEAAVVEGDLSPAGVEEIRMAALTASAGNPMALTSMVGDEGYAAVGVRMVMLDLTSRVAITKDGIISPRGSSVLAALAERLAVQRE